MSYSNQLFSSPGKMYPLSPSSIDSPVINTPKITSTGYADPDILVLSPDGSIPDPLDLMLGAQPANVVVSGDSGAGIMSQSDYNTYLGVYGFQDKIDNTKNGALVYSRGVFGQSPQNSALLCVVDSAPLWSGFAAPALTPPSMRFHSTLSFEVEATPVLDTGDALGINASGNVVRLAPPVPVLRQCGLLLGADGPLTPPATTISTWAFDLDPNNDESFINIGDQSFAEDGTYNITITIMLDDDVASDGTMRDIDPQGTNCALHSYPSAGPNVVYSLSYTERAVVGTSIITAFLSDNIIPRNMVAAGTSYFVVKLR